MISLQHLCSRVFGIYFFDYALQDAVLGEDESAPQGAQHHLAVHLLLAPGAKRLKHLRAGIGQQAEREFVFGAEAGVRLGAILANTHHVVAGRRQRSIQSV